jgi:hypothetical protein
MAKGVTRKAPIPPRTEPGTGVVRLAKAVPTMERSAPVKEPETVIDNGLPCSGRCGHCDCHPCRLHAPI